MSPESPPVAAEQPQPPHLADGWAILEIMGHERLAGKLSEVMVAGTKMLQVEVPAVGQLPAWSRLLGGSSLFSLTPVPEEAARIMAALLRKMPVDQFYLSTIQNGEQRGQLRQALGLPSPPKVEWPAEFADDDEPSDDDERR